jgi:HEAT repeat protein
MRLFISAAIAFLLLQAAPPSSFSKGPEKKPKDKGPPSGGGQLETTIREVGGKSLDEWILELNNRDPSRRVQAIIAIPYFGNQASKAVRKMLDRFLDADTSPRVKAVMAFRLMPVDDKDIPKVVDALAKRLVGDTQQIVRYEAVVTLGRFTADAHSAIPSLVKGTHDSGSWEIRRASVEVLWRTGISGKKAPADPKAVNALIQVVQKDPTRQVRLEAIQGLAAIGRPSDPKLYKQVLDALNKQATTGGSKILAIWSYVALIALLDQDSKQVGADAPLKAVGKFLKSKEIDVRCQTAEALGAAGPRAKIHVPLLLSMLKEDKDVSVRAACHALGGIGDSSDRVIDALVDLLGNKNAPRVVASCNALVALKANKTKVLAALEAQHDRKELNDLLKHYIKGTIDELKKPANGKKPK